MARITLKSKSDKSNKSSQICYVIGYMHGPTMIM